MFLLAWMGKGYQINLAEVPDAMLLKFEKWGEELAERERESIRE